MCLAFLAHPPLLLLELSLIFEVHLHRFPPFPETETIDRQALCPPPALSGIKMGSVARSAAVAALPFGPDSVWQGTITVNPEPILLVIPVLYPDSQKHAPKCTLGKHTPLGTLFVSLPKPV